MNSVTVGLAEFKTMPDEAFCFRVEHSTPGKIWLENKSSKKQWCVWTD